MNMLNPNLEKGNSKAQPFSSRNEDNSSWNWMQPVVALSVMQT